MIKSLEAIGYTYRRLTILLYKVLRTAYVRACMRVLVKRGFRHYFSHIETGLITTGAEYSHVYNASLLK